MNSLNSNFGTNDFRSALYLISMAQRTCKNFWYIKYCSSLMVCKIININEYITSRNFLGTSTFGFLFISLIIHCEQKKWKLIWWKSGNFYFSLFSYFFFSYLLKYHSILWPTAVLIFWKFQHNKHFSY